MAENGRIESLAMGNLREDVKKTIAKLENGAGRVEGCPGHTPLAHGVVLCLKLLLIQIAATPGSPKRHMLASGFATFLAVLIFEFARLWMEK